MALWEWYNNEFQKSACPSSQVDNVTYPYAGCPEIETALRIVRQVFPGARVLKVRKKEKPKRLGTSPGFEQKELPFAGYKKGRLEYGRGKEV